MKTEIPKMKLTPKQKELLRHLQRGRTLKAYYQQDDRYFKYCLLKGVRRVADVNSRIVKALHELGLIEIETLGTIFISADLTKLGKNYVIEPPAIKLSDAQKDVIASMRKRSRLTKYAVGVGLSGGLDCSVATFFVLLNNHLIKPFGKRQFGQPYVLTELGKTITL